MVSRFDQWRVALAANRSFQLDEPRPERLDSSACALTCDSCVRSAAFSARTCAISLLCFWTFFNSKAGSS